MRRTLLLASLGLLLTAGISSADYILIKINVNQLNSFPQLVGVAPSQPGQPPVQPIQPPQQPQPGQPVVPPVISPEDPNGKWVTAWIEAKFLMDKDDVKPLVIGGDPRLGMILQFDHRGKKQWIPYTAEVPTSAIPQMLAGRVKAETFSSVFNSGLNKVKKDSNKTAEKYLHLARMAISRGRLNDFHSAMKEAVDLEPKNVNVANYLKVQKKLKEAVKQLSDPTQTELIEELKSHGYKPKVSEPGHYCIYAPTFGEDGEKLVKRRLALMEESLESFYYWFTVQKGDVPQPPFPKTRLVAVLCGTKDDFLRNHAKWGSQQMVADGFTPRRDNVIVMTAKPRIRDPHYAEFETALTAWLQDGNLKLAQYRVVLTREDLLSGKINDVKEARNWGIYVAAAQTAVLLAKTLEDEGERATVSHEVVRQLLIASEIYPRNVQIPDWMVEGLAAMFETPVGALHPTAGTPSWTHLISFKHLRASKRIPDNAPDALFNVVTDRYFQEARQLSAESLENPKSDALQQRSQQAWELARCSSWSFVYYLKEKRKLDYLFRYGKELNKLPRDMDLDSAILQSCFAEAFEMKDPKDARRIEREPLAIMANSWFNEMQGVNHENLAMKPMTEGVTSIQAYLLQRRSKVDGDSGIPPVAVATQPGTPGIPGATPQPLPPVVNPGAPAVNLVGSSWTGKSGIGSPITLIFQAGNQMMLKSPGIDSTGMWSLAGNSITISITGGGSFTGTINGNMLQASATVANIMITWTATRNPDDNPPPPVNPQAGSNPP